MAYDFNSLTKQADEASNRDGFYTDFEDVDPSKLHQISELTDWMRTKAKGSDVREVIAQLFERTWLENIKEGNANMEVSQARGTYPNLRSRLDEVDSKQNQTTVQLAKKANKDEVTNVMTPKGNIAYASLPMTGNSVGWYYYCPDGDGVHGAGNYVWNGTSWFFGGTGDEGYNLLKKDIEDYGIGLNALPNRSGTYTDNGITYIIQDDKHTISINGTATAGSHFSWSQEEVPSWIEIGKKYIAKVNNGTEKIAFVIYAYVNDSWKLLASTTADEKEFVVPKNTTKLWIRLDVASGDTVSALITPVIADTYTLYKQQEEIAKQQEEIAKQQEEIAKQQKDLEYLAQTNSSFNFIKFKMGFIDYYGVESASNIRAVSDYISGNAIFKIYNPFNVPVTWHFYDANKKHLGVTKSDYPTKENIYIDMTDYAYFRLVTKEDNTPTKSNAISLKKANPVNEVKQIQNVISVAHQGFSTTERFYGDSRLSSYRGAKDAGFSDAETDILWASDGIPVCCHDKTFVDASTGETITISDHTVAELKTYNYYGEKICTFEEILSECKKLGLTLHIDHASEFIEESKFTILFNIVKKYKMQNYVWWASAHESHIRMMLNIFPYAKISRAIDKEWLDANLVSLKKIHNDFPNAKLCVSQNYLEFSDDYTLENLIAKIPSYIGLGLWNVNDIDLYAKYFPYVSAMSSDKISYPMYAMRKIYCETN